MDIKENVSLASYTTLKIGGPAKWFFEAQNVDEIKSAADWSKKNGTLFFVFGGGSNILFSDNGLSGLVVLNKIRGIEEVKNTSNVQIRAGAGENWDELVRFAVDRGLYGVECLSGIPGSVGAAPIQNINAYGQSVEAVISSVEVYDTFEDKQKELSAEECQFAYRNSIFKKQGKGRYVVTHVNFILPKFGMPNLSYHELKNKFAGNNPSLGEIREAVLAIRRRKGMLIADDGSALVKSAGSFFINPVVSAEKYAKIALLAEKCGLDGRGCKNPWFWISGNGFKISAACLLNICGFQKGDEFGKAGLSPYHTLAIINREDAFAVEIKNYAEQIKNVVFQKLGVLLEIEPELVGF